METDKYQRVLKQRIDEVLHYVWDPIGVQDAPAARDEYTTYADHVWWAVIEGQSKKEISDYLTSVTTDLMELDARKDRDDEVADLVLDWADHLRNDNH